MPISIFFPPSPGPAGPGFSFHAVSDFIGPIPQPSHWITAFEFNNGEQATLIQEWPNDTSLKTLDGIMGDLSVPVGVPTNRNYAFTAGATVKFSVQIVGQAGTTDTGSATYTYDPTSHLPELLHTQSTVSGGLTQEQSVQLDQTHQSTYPTISLDALTLIPLTNGPTGQPVGADLNAWIGGVIVRIRSVPENAHVNTPDGDYWTRTLAVVRIYRGSDLWKRVPVHTSSKFITFLDEGIVAAVTAIAPLQWLLQMSVQVTFAEGVTGEVFIMRNP